MGRSIRDALDTELVSGDEIRLGRARFIDHVSTRRIGPASSRGASRPGAKWTVAARGISLGVVGAAAVAAGFAFWWRLPISFQIDSDAGAAAVAGNAGDLIEANAVTPTALRFSEGSSIVVERGGQLRVLALESNGARVLVEKGSADVAITHRHGPGRWRFEAGPVTVSVTGTRFRLDWNPEQHAFGIELKEGSVIVGGDCLPAPRRVQRGDSLRVSCGTAAPAAAAKADAPAAATEPAAEIKAGPVRALRTVAHHETRGPDPDDGDWRALVAAGHYPEGVRAAERAGWSRVCRTANAVDLLALADAARLSGETSRAVDALLTLRQRFPGSTSAATGAFSLGRLAFDQRGAYAEAARWFATYLNDQPQGPLMADAIGRLMEARDRARDRQAARGDAARYLQRFPDGPYAGTARVILAN